MGLVYSCLCLSINKKCLHFSIFQCEISETSPGDGLDNDCDGKFDEERRDGKDNDGDGKVDEDLTLVIPNLRCQISSKNNFFDSLFSG